MGLLKIPLFFLLALLLLTPKTVLASGFQLKTVGALDVDGVTYKHLWYTNGNNLLFTGVALQNTQVTATIDGASNTTTADSSGSWSYSKTLTGGDHQISFSSGGSSVSFTLTIGEVPANIGSLSKVESPTVGTITPTIALLSFGVLLASYPLIVKKLIGD